MELHRYQAVQHNGEQMHVIAADSDPRAQVLIGDDWGNTRFVPRHELVAA